jgi:hypothetical protein
MAVDVNGSTVMANPTAKTITASNNTEAARGEHPNGKSR